MNRLSELEAMVNGANALKSEWSTFKVTDIELALSEIKSLHSKMEAAGKMAEALKYAEEYFDQRAEAQYFPNSPAPTPNTEMAHLVLIRDAYDLWNTVNEGGKG